MSRYQSNGWLWVATITLLVLKWSSKLSVPNSRPTPESSTPPQGEAGIVWINDHHRLDPASPWGGVDDSGVGREFGSESFDDHFNTKSVMVATHDQPFDWYRDTAAQRRLN